MSENLPKENDVDQTEINKTGHPIASLVLGILGLIFWLLPILGLPMTITGLVFGVKALKGEKKGLAMAGVILCVIGIFLSSVNAAWGAYLGATGQHKLVNQYQTKEADAK